MVLLLRTSKFLLKEIQVVEYSRVSYFPSLTFTPLSIIHRITFVDKYTLRIMGSVLPNGPTNPQRRPTASLYDSKRKKKSRDPAGISWSSELHARGLTIADAKDQTAIWSEKVEKLEPEVKDLKKTVSKLEKERSSALVEHRKHDNRNTRSTYGVVQGIRHSLTESRKELGPKEEELRVARRSLYYWNKLTSTTPAKNPSSPPEDTVTSRPSLASPAMQDFVEATCIKEVLDSASDSNHAVSYAGTDRGLKMMHLTVPQSRPDLDAHLNRYSALYSKCNISFYLEKMSLCVFRSTDIIYFSNNLLRLLFFLPYRRLGNRPGWRRRHHTHQQQ